MACEPGEVIENWNRLSSRLIEGKHATERGMLLGLHVLKIIAKILSRDVCDRGSQLTLRSMSKLVGVGSDKLVCSADPESLARGRNRQTDCLGSAPVSSGGNGADVKLGMISEPVVGNPMLGVRRSNGLALLYVSIKVRSSSLSSMLVSTPKSNSSRGVHGPP